MTENSLLLSDPKSTSKNRLYSLYPQLAEDQCAEWLTILNDVQYLDIAANTLLATVGSCCTSFMLLLQGTVRIYQDSDDGREMTIYRITEGDVCLMSLNSLLHDKPFRANAKSETDISVVLFEVEDFYHAMDVSRAFRKLIMTSLVDTVCTMVQSFHDTAFQPLEMRLACLLGRLFERSGSDALSVTHQELSQELGTSRETISRLLKKLEQQECIILKRGKILMGENKQMPGTNHQII